jgi:hypothetical protein
MAEEREGKPSRVKSAADKKGRGVLRINFPGYLGAETLEDFRGTSGLKLLRIVS